MGLGSGVGNRLGVGTRTVLRGFAAGAGRNGCVMRSGAVPGMTKPPCFDFCESTVARRWMAARERDRGELRGPRRPKGSVAPW